MILLFNLRVLRVSVVNKQDRVVLPVWVAAPLLQDLHGDLAFSLLSLELNRLKLSAEAAL